MQRTDPRTSSAPQVSARPPRLPFKTHSLQLGLAHLSQAAGGQACGGKLRVGTADDSRVGSLRIPYVSSVQSLSRVRLFATPWTAARQASLSITNSWSLLKLMSITLVMPSNHLILCHPLLLLPSIFPSIRGLTRFFPSGGQKYWSFRLSISPSSEYSGLMSFRIDWFYLM